MGNAALEFDSRRVDCYAMHLVELQERFGILASEDIVNEAGTLLLRKGDVLNKERLLKISNHTLAKPIDYSISLARTISPTYLFKRCLCLVSSMPDLKQMHCRLNMNEDLKKHCEMLGQHTQLLQKLTILTTKLPREFDKGLLCAWLSIEIAKQLGYSESKKNATFIAAIAHDIGMLHVNPRLLNPNETLTPELWEELKRHPYIGQSLISRMKSLPPFTGRAILEHHECCDGSGYPHGKVKDQIHQMSQIISIADTMLAIRMNRFEDNGRSIIDTFPILQVNQYLHDPEILRAVKRIFDSSELKSTQTLDEDRIKKLLDKLIVQHRYLTHCTKEVIDLYGHFQPQTKNQSQIVIRTITQSVWKAIISSGALDKQLCDWLVDASNALNSETFKEIEDAEILLDEIAWQLKKIMRELQALTSGKIALQDTKRSAIKTALARLSKFHKQRHQLSDSLDIIGLKLEPQLSEC